MLLSCVEMILQVKVLLVDIGEEFLVHYDWLRKIHSDFVKLPVQVSIVRTPFLLPNMRSHLKKKKIS